VVEHHGAYLVSHYTYDIAGNTTSATDANGHATLFSYNDNYSDGQSRNTYGFPTLVTNALSRQTTIQYDYGPGKPTLTVDTNGARTSYAYSDPLDRVTEAVFPNGGTTSYAYPSSTEVDSYQDQNTVGDRALRTQTLYDGLGRISESCGYESSTGYIATTQATMRRGVWRRRRIRRAIPMELETD
jgi:YD repeat-containing protein